MRSRAVVRVLRARRCFSTSPTWGEQRSKRTHPLLQSLAERVRRVRSAVGGRLEQLGGDRRLGDERHLAVRELDGGNSRQVVLREGKNLVRRARRGGEGDRRRSS